MRVFSNTTPFIALASIGRLDLLPKLFSQIHVVEEVIGECAVGGVIAVPPLREFDWIVPVVAPMTETVR
jgi:predicted nucleic acid-binding protein